MSITRNLIAALVSTGLGLASAGPAFARGAAGGGEGGGGGDGPALTHLDVPFAARARFDTGCYRPGDRLTIDWQGLTEFDGQIALVADGGYAPLDVTSWTDRAVMARLGDAPAGRTYPVVWTTGGEVQAVIGELHTCGL